MWTYHSLPQGTPRWVTLTILLLGGCLGLAIGANGLLALYGLSGFTSALYFPDLTAGLVPREAVYLGIVGLAATWSTVWLGFLAVYLNRLSRRAIGMGRLVGVPLLTTLILVGVGYRLYPVRFSVIWLTSVMASLVLGAIIPAIVLGQPMIRRIHDR